jgi:hypothetical protein
VSKTTAVLVEGARQEERGERGERTTLSAKTHGEALLHGGVAVVDELVLLEARHGDLFWMGGGSGEGERERRGREKEEEDEERENDPSSKTWADRGPCAARPMARSMRAAPSPCQRRRWRSPPAAAGRPRPPARRAPGDEFLGERERVVLVVAARSCERGSFRFAVRGRHAHAQGPRAPYHRARDHGRARESETKGGESDEGFSLSSSSPARAAEPSSASCWGATAVREERSCETVATPSFVDLERGGKVVVRRGGERRRGGVMRGESERRGRSLDSRNCSGDGFRCV